MADTTAVCACEAERGFPVACRQPVERQGEYCPACQRLCAASQTDKQPPDSSSATNGGSSAVGPETTKASDAVTHHEETDHHA